MSTFGIKTLLLTTIIAICFCNFYIYFYIFKIFKFMKLSKKSNKNLIENFEHIWSYTEIVCFYDCIKTPAVIFTILSIISSLEMLILITIL